MILVTKQYTFVIIDKCELPPPKDVGFLIHQPSQSKWIVLQGLQRRDFPWFPLLRYTALRYA